MHGLIFAGKLTGVPVKTIPTEGATNGAASLTPVQDLWENSFKKIGDENPEQTVTGMLLFYPHQLVGYLEASEIINTEHAVLDPASKVEIFLEQREVAFLSPSKIWKHLNFSTQIQMFANFAG